MPFAVVAEDFEPFEFDVLTDAFRSTLGLAAYDAKHRARRARGIVAQDLNPTEANALVARLQSTAPVRVVDQAEIPDLGRPRHVRRLSLESESLGVNLGYADDVVHVPWERLVLVSAGVVHIEEQVIDAGLDTSTGGGGEDGNMTWRSSVSKEIRDETLVDLVFRGIESGAILHLRAKSHELVYSEILGERAVIDPTMNARASAFENFRGVVAILGRRAPAADVTPPTIALVSAEHGWAKPPEQSRFDDFDHFTAYNRWRLALAADEVV